MVTHKHIVCYSGGHSSALVAIEVVRKFGKENTILLNHDIHPSVENKDIKRFKNEVANYLDMKITYANHPQWDSMDQLDVVMAANAFKIGNGSALCSHRLKTKPFGIFLDSLEDKTKYIIYYGFDKNENIRIQRRIGILGNMGFKSDYPLALWKSRTIYSTREVGIDPPNTYEVFKHANCVGCLKAGKQHWYIVFCTRPDIWEKAKDAEDKIGYTIFKDMSLSELEPKFKNMKCVGIESTEHVKFQTFWANVRKKLGKNFMKVGEEDSKPCECVF